MIFFTYSLFCVLLLLGCADWNQKPAIETYGVQEVALLGRYQSGHYTCTMRRDIEHSQEPMEICAEESYYTWAKKVLPYAHGYKKERLLAILDLYDDLAAKLAPFPLKYEDVLVWPISFTVPDDYVSRKVGPKAKVLSSVIPGRLETYTYRMRGENSVADYKLERDYYFDMAISYFGITHKKSGWDCMRHLEIMASATLPLFIGIEQSPSSTMLFYPKKLFANILNDPALEIHGEDIMEKRSTPADLVGIKEDVFDKDLYVNTSLALLHYMRSNLTSEAMASYVLYQVNPDARKILFLNVDNGIGDYQGDGLLYGFLKNLGETNVIDGVPRGYVYIFHHELDIEKFMDKRQIIYGNGFSFAQQVNSAPLTLDRDQLEHDIKNNEFDLIIFSTIHNGKPDYYDLVCRHYPKSQVVAIDGADRPVRGKHIKEHKDCVGHYFARELDW